MNLLRINLLLAAAVVSFTAGIGPAHAQSSSGGIDIAQSPLFTATGQPPLMMMVMSRDEQLFKKAYTDYTDLDGDGLLDTSYQNNFSYSGYFDPDLCYGYNSGEFLASGAASNHQCSSAWSGNFLNWVTMSRLDLVRFVLYGGRRSTDSATKTVIERAHVPNDLHAWAKVYTGTDVNRYTPYAHSANSPGISFCNASFSDAGEPQMRVARGNWSEWAATASHQCAWKGDANSEAGTDTPDNNVGLGSKNFTVRVEVCKPDAAVHESFCREYGSSSKPIGLVQEYGESGQMRFGLITGTYSAPRAGGVLRRNIGKFVGNGTTACAAGDEVNLSTGVFCNQANGNEGIVNTLNRFKLTQWNYSNLWNDCGNYGILNRHGFSTNGHLNNPGSTTATAGSNPYACSGWGNPLSEMYAEALRYITNQTATPGFGTGTDLTGLPKPAWLDPYRSPTQGGSPYCANCNILVLSSGLSSFDSDEIPAAPLIGDVTTATNAVGAHEGISGNYLVGRTTATPKDISINTHEDLCTAKNVTNLGLVRGICPDIPSLEGSYLMAGMAHKAWTTDLRPNLLTPEGNAKPATFKNNVQTFAVALAENLPTFRVATSTTANAPALTLAPLCQANNTGTATVASSNWRTCALGSISIGTKTSIVSPNYIYGRPLEADGSAGSFSLVWEDTLWGNDHDNDVVSMMTYCVGTACNYRTQAGTRKKTDGTNYTGNDICWRAEDSPVCGSTGVPTVSDGEVLVRIENLSAYAGNAMLTGFGVTGAGTADDGLKQIALRPGNQNGSVLTSTANPSATWAKPQVRKFTPGTQGANQLKNPLYYAAKYGGFKDANNNGFPDVGEWEKTDGSGEPANFFQVRDPSRLKQQLREVFDVIAAQASPSASVATSTPRFTQGVTLAYEASYNSQDWSGDLRAFKINADGTYGGQGVPPVWSASARMPVPGDRNIFTSEPNVAPPATPTGFNSIEFTRDALSADMKTRLLGTLDSTIYDVDDLVDYLRGSHDKERGQTGCNSATDCPFRVRGSNLGDILNSTPAVAGVTSYGFSQLSMISDAARDSYVEYVESKRAIYGQGSEKPVLYVGANDGMLHALDGSESTTGGAELFAYIPNTVFDNLHHFANPSYLHRYYVDGSPTIGDAYLNGRWKTVIAASAGAGGRGVFALDVSNPRNFGADNVLWEFNSALDSDMGQFVGRPWFGLAQDGKWIAAFGNGYNSASQRAKLFIVDLETGEQIAKIDTGVGCSGLAPNCEEGPNGLATAVIVDNDGDGAGDTIYAGDYQGNMWRFEQNGENWGLGNGGVPLFTAKDPDGVPQPITSGVYTAVHPLGGTMVIFGTGSYLNENDAETALIGQNGRPSVETIYGLWDTCMMDLYAEACGSNTWKIPSRANLQQQRITNYVPMGSDGSQGYREATRNPVGYSSDIVQPEDAKMGWYLDLSFENAMLGERVVARPEGILGKALINTIRPEGNTCEPGSQNATMVLDALTGAAGYAPVTPPGGWPDGAEPPSNAAGTDTYRGPPSGEPPILINPAPILGLGDTDGSTVECSWRSPNPANRPPGEGMPCGRVSWKQVR